MILFVLCSKFMTNMNVAQEPNLTYLNVKAFGSVLDAIALIPQLIFAGPLIIFMLWVLILGVAILSRRIGTLVLNPSGTC